MSKRAYSIVYALLFPFVYVAARLFYRRFKVIGRGNFPKKGTPVILVANHQNALIDPLLCCLTAPRQLHFLTRADVFRNPLLRPFVLALNMLPVYRVRDVEVGKQARNLLTFNTVIARMKRGAAVGIFPEGNHGNMKVIRPLKKGLAQLIDIMAEDSDELREVLIVPVGIDYSDYDHSRSSVVIRYGSGFKVNDLLFGQGERLERYRAIMRRVHENMLTVTLHLDPKEHYAVLRLAEALLIKDHGYHNWPHVHEKLHQLRDQLAAREQPVAYAQEVTTLYETLKKERLQFADLVSPTTLQVSDLFLATLALPGLLLHLPGWQLALAATRRVVIDPQFNSTFRLLFGMLLFGLTWVVLSAGLLTLTAPNVAWPVLLILFISSILALPFCDRLIDLGNTRKAKMVFERSPQGAIAFNKACSDVLSRMTAQQ